MLRATRLLAIPETCRQSYNGVTGRLLPLAKGVPAFDIAIIQAGKHSDVLLQARKTIHRNERHWRDVFDIAHRSPIAIYSKRMQETIVAELKRFIASDFRTGSARSTVATAAELTRPPCCVSAAPAIALSGRLTMAPPQRGNGQWGVVGDAGAHNRRATTEVSVLTAKVAACSSAWTTLVLRARAAMFQEGRTG